MRLVERGDLHGPIIIVEGGTSERTRYRPVSEELGATAAALEQGGPGLWKRLWRSRARPT